MLPVRKSLVDSNLASSYTPTPLLGFPLAFADGIDRVAVIDGSPVVGEQSLLAPPDR